MARLFSGGFGANKDRHLIIHNPTIYTEHDRIVIGSKAFNTDDLWADMPT